MVGLEVEAGWNAPEPVYGSGNTQLIPIIHKFRDIEVDLITQILALAVVVVLVVLVDQARQILSGYGRGGVGLQCLIAGPPSAPQPVGAPGPGGGTGWFAGGGGGGGRTDVTRYGGGGIFTFLWWWNWWWSKF